MTDDQQREISELAENVQNSLPNYPMSVGAHHRWIATVKAREFPVHFRLGRAQNEEWDDLVIKVLEC